MDLILVLYSFLITESLWTWSTYLGKKQMERNLSTWSNASGCVAQL